MGVGRRLQREEIYVCIELIHAVVQEKLTQHCRIHSSSKKNPMINHDRNEYEKNRFNIHV